MEETQAHEPEEAPRRRCKNCDAKLPRKGKFCPSCGQRDTDGRMRMRDLLSKFFANITHLDNKFVKMAWELFIPGKVSVNYFQGKIKRYPHPVQFFFIVMFFFLLIFIKQFDTAALNLFGGGFNIGGDESYQASGITITKSNLYEALQRCMIAREYRNATETLPPEWRDSVTLLALDSLHRKVSRPWEDATTGMLRMLSDTTLPPVSTLDSVYLNMGVSQVTISTLDFATLSPDSIIKKYGYTDWARRIIVKQGIKAIKDQQGLIHRYIGSFGWAVLVLIGIMAGILRLLYWKQGIHYVEHFIFLMHQQAGMYLLLAIALTTNEYFFKIQELWIPVLGWCLISPLIAMHRFYRENWGWTIFKWLIFSLFYHFLLLVIFIATLLVVFVIF